MQAPLELIAEWNPSETNNTLRIRYRIENRSDTRIFPTRELFWGAIETWDGEAWVHVIGGQPPCTSGLEWSPMKAGAVRDAPFYARHPMLLDRGRYRYRVEYSTDDWNAPNRRIRSVISEFRVDIRKPGLTEIGETSAEWD